MPYWLWASGSGDLGFHLSDKRCQLDKINSLSSLTVRSTLESDRRLADFLECELVPLVLSVVVSIHPFRRLPVAYKLADTTKSERTRKNASSWTKWENSE